MLYSSVERSLQRYTGVEIDGAVVPGVSAGRRSTLRFEWAIKAFSYDEVALVTVECGHAVSRGVPVPESWSTGVGRTALAQKAREAAEAAPGRIVGEQVECVFLGYPRAVPEPAEGVQRA